MTLTRLTTALLLALAATGAQAAEKFYESRFGMDEADFRATNEQKFGKGMRLVDFTVANLKGKSVIGATWGVATKEPAGPERIKQLQSLVYLKLSADELKALGQKLGPQGSQLEVVDIYDVGGRPTFAAVFSPPNEGTVATMGAFLDDEQAQTMRDQAQANNFDIARLEAYVDGDHMLTFPSFVQRGKADLQGLDEDTAEQFRAQSAKMQFTHMQPLSITVYRDEKGYPDFMGTFEAGSDRRVVVDELLEQFVSDVLPTLDRGAVVMDMDSFVTGDQVYYSAVIQLAP
jgi:hypothetical protein